MDNFMELLIKKADADNNEYYNYRRPVRTEPEKPVYTKLTEPTADSYVVFDLETTGMNCRANRIIEIGAVKVEKSRITGTFSTLIDPRQYIPGMIVQKVHITNQMVKGRPHIEDILPEFVDFAGGLPLAAHNAPFDMSFLLENARLCGIEIKNPVLDTLALSRRYNKECGRHSLAYLTEFFGIDLKNAHRAYFDAAAAQQIYEIIRKKYLAAQQTGYTS